MATVSTDKRTGNIVVRAYGGKDPVTGKVIKPSKTLPAEATRGDVERAIEYVDFKAGIAKRTGRALTVGGLVSYYLEEVCPSKHSPTTVESYESNARCYVYPTIGGLSYDKAGPGDFAALYARMAKPKDEGGFGVSQTTVKKVHHFISGCFNALLAEKVVDRNVVAGLKVGCGVSVESEAFEHGDFDRLLARLLEADGVGGDATLDTALLVDAFTGVRRGELAGFRINDWNPRTGELRVMWSIAETKGGRVRKKPKRDRVRHVAVAATAASRIERHIAMQAEWLAERGVAQTRDTPLFADPNGEPIAPRKFYRRFVALKKELGLAPGLMLKSIRHTQATYLLEDGENIKLVQQRMGHASHKTTMDIYAHVTPGRDRAAADRFGEIAGCGQRADSGRERGFQETI